MYLYLYPFVGYTCIYKQLVRMIWLRNRISQGIFTLPQNGCQKSLFILRHSPSERPLGGNCWRRETCCPPFSGTVWERELEWHCSSGRPDSVLRAQVCFNHSKWRFSVSEIGIRWQQLQCIIWKLLSTWTSSFGF